MGYACPVCGVPAPDAEHLANHLAFTALLGDADHEAFLDERVPDWGDRDPEGLGAAVVEFAEAAEDPRVFEDTTGHDGAVPNRADATAADAADVDGEAAEILREARELTARMRDEREE
ncbi:MAG: DUF5810 domain-containing protein [Halobacteriaceae archaeon]